MNVYKEIKQLHLVINAVIENKVKEEGITFSDRVVRKLSCVT